MDGHIRVIGRQDGDQVIHVDAPGIGENNGHAGRVARIQPPVLIIDRDRFNHGRRGIGIMEQKAFPGTGIGRNDGLYCEHIMIGHIRRNQEPECVDIIFRDVGW